MTRLSMWQRQDAGFTLPEILVTLLIIGVISGIAVSTLGKSRQSSIQQSCKSSYSTLLLAISSYQSDSPTAVNNLYIPKLNDLVPNYLSSELLNNSNFILRIDESATALSGFVVSVISGRTNTLLPGNAPAACEKL